MTFDGPGVTLPSRGEETTRPGNQMNKLKIESRDPHKSVTEGRKTFTSQGKSYFWKYYGVWSILLKT